MIRLLGLTGTLTAASTSFLFAGCFVAILLRKNVGHRKLLWMLLIYTTLQTCSAASVSYDLYRQTFSLVTSIFRVASACAGFACAARICLFVADIVSTLRDSEIANQVRQDKQDDRLMAAQNITAISKNAQASSERHLRVLQRQVGG